MSAVQPLSVQNLPINEDRDMSHQEYARFSEDIEYIANLYLQDAEERLEAMPRSRLIMGALAGPRTLFLSSENETVEDVPEGPGVCLMYCGERLAAPVFVWESPRLHNGLRSRVRMMGNRESYSNRELEEYFPNHKVDLELILTECRFKVMEVLIGRLELVEHIKAKWQLDARTRRRQP